MTYRPAVQVSTSEPAPVRKKVQNWTDVPADLDIPSGVPGWASQPFAPSKLEEGEVPPNVRAAQEPAFYNGCATVLRPCCCACPWQGVL